MPGVITLTIKVITLTIKVMLKWPRIRVHDRPPEASLEERDGSMDPRMTGKAGGVCPL